MESQSLSTEFLKSTLELRDFKTLRRIFNENEIVDIAEKFSDLATPECIALFRLVPRNRRPDLFTHLALDSQKELIGEFPKVVMASLLNEMEPDDRTSLLEELDDVARDYVLQALAPEERQIARQLLSYPEQSVGRLMTPDFLALNSSMSVSEALHFIHWTIHVPVEYLHHLFVVDSDSQLIGEVSLASLVVCDPPTMLISSIMKKNIIFLTPEKEEAEAVEIFRKYERSSIPVVDTHKKLIGMVTSDDVFDVAEEFATEDIQQFGGHSALEDSYFGTSLITMFQKRAGWLAFLFLSSIISGQTIRSFESLLSKWGFLVFFFPIVNSAGGNSGTQAASLIIRGLAINELSLKDVWRVFRKEIVLSLLLGIVLGAIGFLIALKWGLGKEVGFIVASSLVCVVMFGVFFGSMLPFVFRSIGLDPAVVSSPFITTLVDFTGIIILFNFATYLMKYFGLN